MSSNITYKESLNKAYLKGFFEMLDKILDKGEKKEEKQREEAKESPNNSKRDQLVPIYMYCKNLWDKWLIAGDNTKTIPYTNPYTVEKFFKNFLFIDSFYRNIYNLLPVNCQNFINLFESLATNDTSDVKSLYSFIGYIAKDCRCLFVAVPDYINLGTVDNDGKMHEKGLENMSKIFRCVPHNEMRKIETDNKFIVIYTHEPSKNQDDSKGFVNDTINICDSDGQITEQAKELFGGITPPQDIVGAPKNEIKLNNMTASAYPVPSFAVAFSGHNNHIFKSVDVNMDNPIATEHSINILSNIAQLGSGNGQKVAYQGQDVFPIFSNYAYQSTVTMMGNAQIQPLMYYQLMNIPMWKGAYMIFNVKHTITPGNMTTTFTGMKMSQNCVPFLKKWVYPVECVVPESQVVTMSSDNGGSVDMGTCDLTEFAPAPYPFQNIPEDQLLRNKSGAIIKTYDQRNLKFTPLISYSQLNEAYNRGIDKTSPKVKLTTFWNKIPAGDVISSSKSTAGYKYNNPCSVSPTKYYIGCTGSHNVADGQLYAHFDTLENGIASAMLLLKKKYNGRSPIDFNNGYQGYYKPTELKGLTMLRIVHISNLSRDLCIQPTQRMDTDDPNSLMALTHWIAKKECGYVLGKSILERAYKIAFH